MKKSVQFPIGAIVRKKSGSEWVGKVVGYYSTKLTPNGVCVESISHAGSVQIYPEKALEAAPEGIPEDPMGCMTKTFSIENLTPFGSWQLPESAPRNGSIIIADFGWAWPIPAMWDPYMQCWRVVSVAVLQTPENPDSYWFEVDSEDNSQLERWMPMPALPRN
jgi:hypothetical protein